MSAPRSTRRLFCASLGRALVAVAGCARPPWPPPVSPSPSAPEIAGKYLGVFRGQETV